MAVASRAVALHRIECHGQVFKACLDERADRHVCMAIADECLTTCRAKLTNTASPNPEDTKTFQRRDLLGIWHGERRENGSIIRWLTHRDIDGTYADIFLVCIDGVPDSLQREFGNWDYMDGIYRTITRVIEDANGRRQPDTLHTDRYRVLFLNTLAFTYVHTTKNKKYSVTKVDDSYRVDCS